MFYNYNKIKSQLTNNNYALLGVLSCLFLN